MVLDDLATKMTWIVNGSRIKHYLGGDVESLTTIVQLKESKPWQERPANKMLKKSY